jgi:tetratricopeptide (TPR) repeat protein
MLEERQRHDEALVHFAGAVRYQPNYADAHLAYGDALRRSGRFKEALSEYDEALAILPRSSQARLGHAIALVGARPLARGARPGSRSRLAAFPIGPSCRWRWRACWRLRLTPACATATRPRPRADIARAAAEHRYR